MAEDGFDHIARCSSLSEGDIAYAIETREDTRALLTRLAVVSAPATGAAKVLLVYARMATTACGWLDGDLRIDLSADGEVTVVEACTELGGGLRERVFPPLRLNAPLVEIARAVHLVSHMIAPLVVAVETSRHLALSATEVVRRTTHPPPPISIAEDSLFVPGAEAISLPLGVEELSSLPLLPLLPLLPRVDLRARPAPVAAEPEVAVPRDPTLPPPAPPPGSETPDELTAPHDVDSGWDDD